MLKLRFSRGYYFVGLCFLLGAQLFAVKNLENPVYALFLLQVVKLPLTVARLNDLARSADDAIWSFVPIANLALASICLTSPTPSPERWQKLRGRWEGQVTAFGAFARGASLCAKTAAVGGSAAVVYGLISAFVSYHAVRLLETLQFWDAAKLAQMNQGLVVLLGILGLYTLLQFRSRKTASRASWFPSLFLLPTLLLALTVAGVRNNMHQSLGLVFLNLPWQAWGILWQSVGGAALAIVWIRSAQVAKAGQTISLSQIIREMRARLTDVAGAHGARVHAVLIGMQILIPGIFYALQLAFTDMVAVLHPERSALSGSAELTWSIRNRLFKVFTIWLIASFALSLGTGLLVESMDVIQASFLDLREMSLKGIAVQEVVWAFTTWWLEMALLVMFWERLERTGWATSALEPAGDAVK